MLESTPSRALSWYNLSPRTTAGLLQLLMWGLLGGFYIAWNNRPNYHFEGPIWPLVLIEMGFAIILFNALVYFIIPRWLLRGRIWRALAGSIGLLYVYRLWFYAGALLTVAYVPIDPVMRRTLMYYVPTIWADLTSGLGLFNTFLDVITNTLFPILVSFLAYALIVERQRLALERDHLRLELSYLKAQINPQFLFSTLAQLQGLTQARDPQAGEVLLHLADLMRYTLYETDPDRVLLHRELEFLADYLALERLHHPTATITHEVVGTATTQQIAPLLLHPFFERLFAGLNPAGGTTQISSRIQITPAAVELELTRRTAASLAPTYRTDAAIGAALRRLQLQYPEQHTVQLAEDHGRVHAQLTIRLTP